MPLASTSLKLDTDLKQRLQNLAQARRRSANWLIGEAIGQFLTREEARQDFNRETVERWNDYAATGRHVTAEAANAWFDRLEAGEKIPPPEPE